MKLALWKGFTNVQFTTALGSGSGSNSLMTVEPIGAQMVQQAQANTMPDAHDVLKVAGELRLRKVAKQLLRLQRHAKRLTLKEMKRGELDAHISKHFRNIEPETREAFSSWLSSQGYRVYDPRHRSSCDCYMHYGWSWKHATQKTVG